MRFQLLSKLVQGRRLPKPDRRARRPQFDGMIRQRGKWFGVLGLKQIAVALLAAASIGSSARADILLTDTFNGNSLDPAKWTVNTNIDRGPASVVVANGRAEISNRAHLISVDQFNPNVVGPLRIEGTWSFGQSGLPAGDFFQALTRSDGLPDNSNFGETTNGLEFFANANGGGSLQIASRVAGVGTTLASTAMHLQAGELYSFLILDDGNSLSFTFSELGGSHLTDTITATSALTFASNHFVVHNRESNNGSSETSYLYDVTISNVRAVPEPGSLALLGLGLPAAWLWVRRRAKDVAPR